MDNKNFTIQDILVKVFTSYQKVNESAAAFLLHSMIQEYQYNLRQVYAYLSERFDQNMVDDEKRELAFVILRTELESCMVWLKEAKELAGEYKLNNLDEELRRQIDLKGSEFICRRLAYIFRPRSKKRQSLNFILRQILSNHTVAVLTIKGVEDRLVMIWRRKVQEQQKLRHNINKG